MWLTRLKNPALILVILALTIRLIGIDHGFPFIYHPDEPTVIRSALGIRFDPNPGHFDWPHVYFYMNYFGYMVFAKFRAFLASTSLATTLPILWNDNLVFYLLSRILTAVLGSLTVVPIYLWVKAHINPRAALLAGLIFALAPFHVRFSHYALIDVPMLFFLCWALYLSEKHPLGSGFMLGLATSTKYNGILGGLFIFLWYLLTKKSLADFFKVFLKVFLKVGIAAAAGFIVGTPYAVLDFATFIRTDSPLGALWQFTNVGHVTFITQLQNFFTALSSKLPDDFGYGAAILFALAIGIIVRQRLNRIKVSSYAQLSAVVFLALTLFISGADKTPSHYYMPTYPFLFLTVGWVADFLGTKVSPLIFKWLVVALAVPSIVLSALNIDDLIKKTSTNIYGGDVEYTRQNPVKIDQNENAL